MKRMEIIKPVQRRRRSEAASFYRRRRRRLGSRSREGASDTQGRSRQRNEEPFDRIRPTNPAVYNEQCIYGIIQRVPINKSKSDIERRWKFSKRLTLAPYLMSFCTAGALAAMAE